MRVVWAILGVGLLFKQPRREDKNGGTEESVRRGCTSLHALPLKEAALGRPFLGFRHPDTCKPGSFLPSLLADGPAGPEPLPGNCFP